MESGPFTKIHFRIFIGLLPAQLFLCELPGKRQSVQDGEEELYCLSFTGTLGFILICATAVSASVCEAYNTLTMLTTATSGSLASRQNGTLL